MIYLDSLGCVEVPVAKRLGSDNGVDNGTRWNVAALADLVGLILSEHSSVCSLVDDNDSQLGAIRRNT